MCLSFLRCIISSELEEKAPIMEEERLVYERMTESYNQLSTRHHEALAQTQKAENSARTARKEADALLKENTVLRDFRIPHDYFSVDFHESL